MVAPMEQPQTAQPQARCDPGETAKGPSLTEITQDLKLRFAEILEYTKYLVAVETDRVKHTAIRIGFLAALGIVGLIVATGALVAATTLLLIGIAGVIGNALGSFWLGATIMGAAILILTAIGAFIGYRMVTRGAIKKLRLKYVERRQKQKKEFGRDIKEVAHA